MVSDSVPFTQRLADGWRRSSDAVWLAFVPVVTALFSVEKIARVASRDGFHFSFKLLLFPAPAENVWTYVNVPQSGLYVEDPGPLWLLPVSVLVTAVLLGGFLGSVRRLLDADETGYAFARDSLTYLWQMAVWTGVPTLVVAGLVLLVGESGGSVGAGAFVPLFLVLLAAAFVLGYLFYAAPFLVVLREAGIAEALAASYGLAVDGGPYASYALGYVAFGLVASAAASLVVLNLGVVGLLVGIPACARLGLATSTATLRFVSDIDDASPTLCEWDGDDPSDGSCGRFDAADPTESARTS